MKYIRTKDGRILYLIEKCEYKENKITYIVGWDWEDNFEINQEDVIKQADTIEELCDEFVCNNELFEKIEHIKMYEDDICVLKSYGGFCVNIQKGNQVYGAIWTDKGLIYVAKMNENGVLELL